MLDNLEISKSALELVKQTLRQSLLSVRGYHKMLRVARTIADLADSEEISELHMAEALHYRQRDLLA